MAERILIRVAIAALKGIKSRLEQSDSEWAGIAVALIDALLELLEVLNAGMAVPEETIASVADKMG